jgi:hypothetical protein
VSWGVRYWAKRILGSTGPLMVPARADRLTQVLRFRNMLRSSTWPGWVAVKRTSKRKVCWGLEEPTCDAVSSADGARAAVALARHGHGH